MDQRKRTIVAQLVLARCVVSDAPDYVQWALKKWCDDLESGSEQSLSEELSVSDHATVELKTVKREKENE